MTASDEMNDHVLIEPATSGVMYWHDNGTIDWFEQGMPRVMVLTILRVQAWCWNVDMSGASRDRVEKLLCREEALGLLAAAGDGCARFL